VELTERQKEILRAVIREFMEEAEEVGSLSLVEKYDLGVSSATIRNEMVKLMGLGLLEKSHISSGRLPTDQALRLYVTNFLGRRELNPMVSVEIRQGIYRDRFDKDVVIKSILDILSKETESLVFLILDNQIRYFGVSQLFKYSEFGENIEKLKKVINILEDENYLRNMVNKFTNSGVSLLIGGESGVKEFTDCAIAFIRIPFWDQNHSYVGVIGSKRMDYSIVIPALNEVRNALQTSMSGWR
jgi:transcriptional regulator of heat shock response